MKPENSLKILIVASGALFLFSLTYIFSEKIRVISVFHDNVVVEKRINSNNPIDKQIKHRKTLLSNVSSDNNSQNTISSELPIEKSVNPAAQPNFYRGIYLTNSTSRSEKKMDYYIRMAKKYHINVFVIDTQNYRFTEYKIPEKIMNKIKNAGIWPVARVVVFHHGFDHYPVKKTLIQNRIDIAKRAARSGFGEIQFDYIRFADTGRLNHIGLQERYDVVEGFLKEAKKQLKPLNMIISADIFGRIPLNKNDRIGQKMEGLSPIVDIIAPMAYPSHYTWNKKYYTNPYYTVHYTSSEAKKRTNGQAKIVTWIQGFRLQWEHKEVKMSLKNYIIAQIRATEEAGIKGFMIWNASQKYQTSFLALQEYYQSKKKESGEVLTDS